MLVTFNLTLNLIAKFRKLLFPKHLKKAQIIYLHFFNLKKNENSNQRTYEPLIKARYNLFF